jgi:hypothetical protein
MKNPINVIDQELIDWFKSSLSNNIDGPSILDIKTKELLAMSIDLIEINAELTMQLQKLKGDLCVKNDSLEAEKKQGSI